MVTTAVAVLLVDDYPDARERCTRVSETLEGFDVIEAANGLAKRTERCQDTSRHHPHGPVAASAWTAGKRRSRLKADGRTDVDSGRGADRPGTGWNVWKVRGPPGATAS